MATKLYVGGIPYTTTEAALSDLFAKAGAVSSASIIIDRMTGRSKGFGFVEMSNDDEAQAAINMYNGQDFEGRKLTVNVARPLEPRAPRDRRPMEKDKKAPKGAFLLQWADEKFLFSHFRVSHHRRVGLFVFRSNLSQRE